MLVQEIKTKFPDEWILLGNPLFEGSEVSEGEVILHGKNKTTLAEEGRLLRDQYKIVKFIYTGTFQPIRRIGILKRI